MRLILAIAVMAATVGGPAWAQGGGFGTFKPSGFGAPSSPPAGSMQKPSYGQEPSTASRPRTYGAPAAGGFKPYEPFKPGSTYASPKAPSYGAKPCETSVYVNACDKRR